MDIKCPDCGGHRIEKYGKTKAGKPKYHCLATGCGRQFVAGSDHLIDQETKGMVVKLIGEDLAPKKILRIVTACLAERASTPAGQLRGFHCAGSTKSEDG